MQKARVAKVKIGHIEIDGLLLPDGEYGVAVPQVAEIVITGDPKIDGFKTTKNQFAKVLKRICGESFKTSKCKSEFNKNQTSWITLEDFEIALAKLDRKGNKKAQELKAQIDLQNQLKACKYDELEAIGLSDVELSLTDKLVKLHDGVAVTDSLTLAEAFDKQHKSVLREIGAKLRSSPNPELESFYSKHIQETTYFDSSNRSQKMYLLTREGFTLVAMGFTGEKAELFKVRYIQAFEKMTERLRGYAIAHFLGRTDNKQLVYVIKNPITNLIKIGVTNNIKRRRDQLECATGCELEVVFCTPVSDNAKEIEKNLHEKFADFRQRGEWFNLEASLAVEAVVKHPITLKAAQSSEPQLSLNFNS